MKDILNISTKLSHRIAGVAIIFFIILFCYLFYKPVYIQSTIYSNTLAVRVKMINYLSLQQYFRQYSGVYCKEFSNLYHNSDFINSFENNEARKVLIEDLILFSNAFLLNKSKGGKSVPYKGYFFQKDYLGQYGEDYDMDRIPLLAFPAVYGETGIFVLWIDSLSNIWIHDPKVNIGTPAEELINLYINNTPLSKNNDGKWEM